MTTDCQKSTSDKNKARSQKGKRPPKRITETYLHNAGLYYLQRFAASSEHFRTVMRRKIMRSCRFHKDQNPEQCEKMLDELVKKFIATALLDDEAYMRGMVASMRRRGLSARAIEGRLKIKGLETDDIRRTLSEHDTEIYQGQDADLQAALKLARRKRFGPYARSDQINQSNEDITKIRKRQLAAFARAGFSYQIADTVLKMSLQELEN